MGAGKAIVSTPYWAAEELLDHGRGKLVGFGNSDDMACAILEILKDDSLSLRMRMQAYQYGRKRTWPKVAEAYLKVFEEQSAPISIPSWPRLNLPRSQVPVYGRHYVSESA